MFLLSYFALWLFIELSPLSMTVLLFPVLIMDRFPSSPCKQGRIHKSGLSPSKRGNMEACDTVLE